MKKHLLLVSMLTAAIGAHAAIKKGGFAEKASEPAPPAANAPAKPGQRNPLSDFLEQSRKNAEQDGSRPQLKVEPMKLESMLRDLLEKQGIAKEKLKNANFFELLRMMQEQDPNGLKFGGPGQGRGLFSPIDPEIQKKLDDQFRDLLEGHQPGTVDAAKAAFVFRDGKKPKEQLGLGTCVNGEGWILTKASEVKDASELQCLVKGEWLPAKIGRTWAEHDLALVKIDAKDLPSVKWSSNPAPVVGSFITAVAPEGKQPTAIGVVSVAARSQQEKGRGFLGVQLDADDKGITIRELIPGGAALKSGLQKNDRLLAVDGQKPDSLFQFTKLISDRKAGDKVNLKLQRGAEVIEKEIALGDRANRPGSGQDRRTDQMNSMGSTISGRRDDFPSVMQTDFPIDANECGGPVTDLDGNVIGLVIARSGRVETLILPSATLREVLGKVDFAKEAAALSANPAKPGDKK